MRETASPTFHVRKARLRDGSVLRVEVWRGDVEAMRLHTEAFADLAEAEYIATRVVGVLNGEVKT